MKKTMKNIARVIGVIMTLMSVFIGVYVGFSTFMLTIYRLIIGPDKIKWRYMIADFFGLLTSEEIDILEKDNEDFED